MTNKVDINGHNKTRERGFIGDQAVRELDINLENVFKKVHRFIITKVSNDIQNIMTSEEIKHALHARSIIDSITSVAFNFQNENHIILDCNQAYIDMVGFPKEEIIGKKCTEVCCTGNNCVDNCPIEHIKKGDRESFLCDMNGRFYEKKADMVYDNSGNFLGYVEIYQDRTNEALKEVELSKLNTELAKNIEFLDSTLENSRQGVWEWNVQTGEVWASDNFYKMLGYNPQEDKMSYDFWENIIHPDDKSVIMSEIGRHISGLTKNFQFTYRLKAKDDEYKWITATGKVTEYDKDGKPLKASGAHMDFTEVTNMKNFMLENEQKMHALISSIPDMLITMDKEGNYKQVHTGDPIYRFGNRHEGSNLSRIFDEENSKKILDAINEAILKRDEDKVIRVDYFLVDNGVIRYYNGSIKAINETDVVINTKDVTQEKELNARNEHMAMHDSLTSLPNRRYFNEELDRLISYSERKNIKLAVLYFDLDGFKKINDTYGHNVGDEFLIEIAYRLKKITRDSDFVARIGGDEFAMVINDYEEVSNIWTILERILEEAKKPYNINDALLQVTTSIGVSLFPHDGDNSIELQKKADIAMYDIKGHGKNSYRFYNEDITMIGNKKQSRVSKILNDTIEKIIKTLRLTQRYI